MPSAVLLVEGEDAGKLRRRGLAGCRPRKAQTEPLVVDGQGLRSGVLDRRLGIGEEGRLADRVGFQAGRVGCEDQPVRPSLVSFTGQGEGTGRAARASSNSRMLVAETAGAGSWSGHRDAQLQVGGPRNAFALADEVGELGRECHGLAGRQHRRRGHLGQQHRLTLETEIHQVSHWNAARRRPTGSRPP